MAGVQFILPRREEQRHVDGERAIASAVEGGIATIDKDRRFVVDSAEVQKDALVGGPIGWDGKRRL